MRYIVQIQENEKWIYDGAYDDIGNAKDYAERCFYKEGLNARVIIETVEIIEEYIGI